MAFSSLPREGGLMGNLTVRLDPGQRLFLISDLHFGHNNICKESFSNRPWDGAKEMDEALIRNWNETVTEKDVVFHLGDFAWFPYRKEMRKLFKQLNAATIYCILGNHDSLHGFSKTVEEDPRVKVLGEEEIVYVEGLFPKTFEMYLSHCPLMTWPHRPSGVPNFFGHIHSGPRVNPDNYDLDLPLWKGLQYDCGADNNNYRPVEIFEVLNKIGYDTSRFQE